MTTVYVDNTAPAEEWPPHVYRVAVNDWTDPVSDSETDFDDEWEDDQLPMDVVEALEAGVDLDDPEGLLDL